MAQVDIPPGRHLLISSPGGHLVELLKWSRRVGSTPDSLWVTYQCPQTESLLEGQRVLDVPYVAPRDARAAFKVFLRILDQVDWKHEYFVSAISTGAGLGLAGLAAARLHRVQGVFIESLARLDGPGLTGRIVALDPTIKTYSQWPHWANRRWQYTDSVLGIYEVVPREPFSRSGIFVTLGTSHSHRFDAIVDAVLATGLANERSVWQLGATRRENLPGKVEYLMSGSEFEQAARSADVVVTHAGVGTVLTLFEMGICPVVVPRRPKKGEHVDDHQLQFSSFLSAQGIAVVCDASELRKEQLVLAAARAVRVVR